MATVTLDGFVIELTEDEYCDIESNQEHIDIRSVSPSSFPVLVEGKWSNNGTFLIYKESTAQESDYSYDEFLEGFEIGLQKFSVERFTD